MTNKPNTMNNKILVKVTKKLVFYLIIMIIITNRLFVFKLKRGIHYFTNYCVIYDKTG